VAQVDFQERQLTLKLVYYGPPLSGKTTNLKALHARVDDRGRGRLMVLDTRDDRTLFFDLLPIFFRAQNLSFRIKVYTVPGQPIHETTRRVVLQGADGVVFVADSGPEQQAANLESWHGLAGHLQRLQLDRVPLVVQYNKRDLPGRVDLDRADHFGDPERPLLEACALTGEGVLTTFHELLSQVWRHLDASFRLEDKFGIDAAAFQEAVCAHVGADGRDILGA
jgi:signal recognition particle receptor subunit beta